MLCCHLLSLTANKAWGFELSRQPKVILCDVRAFADVSWRGVGWSSARATAQCRNNFFATLVVKDSGCIKEERLCSPLLRTMRNLLGRDLVPVCSVSNSLVWAVKSEESLLEGWGRLFTEVLRNAGMVRDVWTRYMEAHRVWRTPTLSFGSKMEIRPCQPLKIWELLIPLVFKQLVEGHLHRWGPHIQTPGCSHSSFHGQVGEDSSCLAHSQAYGALWPPLLYHLSYSTQRTILGPINSFSSVGLWEKPAELIDARIKAREVCRQRKKKTWSRPEERVPQTIGITSSSQVSCSVLSEGSPVCEGSWTAPASTQRSFSCTPWGNSISIF